MHEPRTDSILISPIYHAQDLISQADAIISILGPTDKLPFPDVGSRKGLRLSFDDTLTASKAFIPPNREHIAELIGFARAWNGVGTLLVHCRAGRSRSPAAAMIAAAALGRLDSADLGLRVRTAKTYFRPNETMLRLADDLLGSSPSLIDLARSVPVETQVDQWGPARVPLMMENA